MKEIKSDEWEDITPADVKIGDEIYLHRWDDNRNFEYWGKVLSEEEHNKGWFNVEGEWVVEPRSIEAGRNGNFKTELKRKLPPFQFPTKVGSVIEANWNVGDSPQTFVKVRPSSNMHDDWFHVETGNLYRLWELELLYKRFRLKES